VLGVAVVALVGYDLYRGPDSLLIAGYNYLFRGAPVDTFSDTIVNMYKLLDVPVLDYPALHSVLQMPSVASYDADVQTILDMFRGMVVEHANARDLGVWLPRDLVESFSLAERDVLADICEPLRGTLRLPRYLFNL